MTTLARVRRALAWLAFVVPIVAAGYLVGLSIAIAAGKP